MITHIQADFADGKDNQFLISIVEALQKRFTKYNLPFKRVVADAGYSSGEVYQYLEKAHITPYIPIHGQFAVERDGFNYDAKNDAFICSQGKMLPFGRYFVDREYHLRKTYRASRKDCNQCPGDRVPSGKLV